MWTAAAWAAAFLQISSAGAAPADDTDWPLLGNNAQMQHYSPLSEINEKTVTNLGLAWSADVPSLDGLVGNPLVAAGAVYQSGPQGRVYANDVRSGRLLWRFDAKTNFEGDAYPAYKSSRFNRGLALSGDRVFASSGDCHLFALNRRSGAVLWDVLACDPKRSYGITGAPRVGGGLVFMGNACADTGQSRGYVDAYDQETGRRRWRFYTVPKDQSEGNDSDVMRMAGKSWGAGVLKRSHGCGSAWDAMTYDPVLNMLYVGVDGPWPWSPAERGTDRGDELFTDSIVAIKADTGEYVWHFKETPDDGWNLSATMHIMLADLDIEGRRTRVVLQAPKNGFFYVLDAKTGKFISANNYLPVTWALGVDPQSGRPIPNRAANYWEHPGTTSVASPGPTGSHNWQAMAFNPATNLVYIPAIWLPTLMSPDPKAFVGGMVFDEYFGMRGDPKWRAAGYLIAWDPRTQSQRWRVELPSPINGGLLSTGGNLVMQGGPDGRFNAYAADSGRRLWSFDTHESIMAAASTVEIDGEQVILVSVGNSASAIIGTYLAKFSSTPATRGPTRLLAFKLNGHAALPPFSVPPISKPPLPQQSLELAKRGETLYGEHNCAGCHGAEAENASGVAKDLRFASAQTQREFSAIVIGGSRHDRGMPAFPDLTPEDASAIQAYIINQAWAAYNTDLPPRAN
jgi:PQQ-dependent dehydrogenase (methanol/ethanol family)